MVKIVQDKDDLGIIHSFGGEFWHYVYKSIVSRKYLSLCGRWMYSPVLHDLKVLHPALRFCSVCRSIYNYNFSKDN